MRVVIIGGGIAGLTLAVYLQRLGMECQVNERRIGTPGGGHAFLMHHDGLEILNSLAVGTGLAIPGQLIRDFTMKRPDGRALQEIKLGNWHCMKRTELSAFLCSLLTVQLHDNRTFSHFIYENGRVVAAVFENGEIEHGDLFVAADGGFSKIRNEIFGPVDFKMGGVKEVVGIAQAPEIAAAYAGVFSKFQMEAEGLAFGMIPTSATEIVWFIQYNPAAVELLDTQPEHLKAFCYDLLKDFPEVVQQVLNANDFSQTYLWNTRDFDLLQAFHKENVVLIGDAAHLALPFTSAGTTNAMMDAQTLALLLHRFAERGDYESAFREYYASRSVSVLKHLEFGRKLRDAFLDPMSLAEDARVVPLI